MKKLHHDDSTITINNIVHTHRIDLIIIFTLIIMGILSYVCISYFNSTNNASKVQIVVEGDVVKELSLSQNIEYKVNIDEDNFNIIKISDGKVQITDANCHNKICVDHSSISKSGESIICLPHKLVIRITGDNNKLDSIVK